MCTLYMPFFAGPFYRHTLGNHLIGYRDHPMHSTRRPITDLTSSSTSSFDGSPPLSPSSPSLISDRPVKRKGEVIDDDDDDDDDSGGNSGGGGGNDVNGFQEAYTFFKQVAVGKPGRKEFSRGGRKTPLNSAPSETSETGRFDQKWVYMRISVFFLSICNLDELDST